MGWCPMRSRAVPVRLEFAWRSGRSANSVLWLTLRESLLLIVIGVGIGMPAIFGAGQWIASLLVGVKTTNIAALSSAAAILFGAAILACYIPARRATRVERRAGRRIEK